MIPKTWRLFLLALVLLVGGYLVNKYLDGAVGIWMMVIGFLLLMVDRFASIFRWGAGE
jgi:hypothetical protein